MAVEAFMAAGIRNRRASPKAVKSRPDEANVRHLPRAAPKPERLAAKLADRRFRWQTRRQHWWLPHLRDRATKRPRERPERARCK
jgi:hypothetical protein